jgi:hypothetical protein
VRAELTTESHVHAAIPLCLALNRNQIELMCRAYENSDRRWLINPQFIDPLPQSPPYPCATHGFDEPNGDRAPYYETIASPRPAGLGALTQALASPELNQI